MGRVGGTAPQQSSCALKAFDPREDGNCLCKGQHQEEKKNASFRWKAAAPQRGKQKGVSDLHTTEPDVEHYAKPRHVIAGAKVLIIKVAQREKKTCARMNIAIDVQKYVNQLFA